MVASLHRPVSVAISSFKRPDSDVSMVVEARRQADGHARACDLRLVEDPVAKNDRDEGMAHRDGKEPVDNDWDDERIGPQLAVDQVGVYTAVVCGVVLSRISARGYQPCRPEPMGTVCIYVRVLTRGPGRGKAGNKGLAVVRSFDDLDCLLRQLQDVSDLADFALSPCG